MKYFKKQVRKINSTVNKGRVLTSEANAEAEADLLNMRDKKLKKLERLIK